MKNFWKWVLGIVIVLVVLFVLGIGGRLLMYKLFPVSPVDFDGLRVPMMMGGRGLVGIGMPHRSVGFMGSGWLVPLALIGLVIYGAYRLGIRKNTIVETPTVQSPVAQVRTCDKCGSFVQEGWNHCANCGRKL